MLCGDFILLQNAKCFAVKQNLKRVLMDTKKERLVTIIYYCDTSLELLHEARTFPENENGRVIIPLSFKEDKSIIAVCAGEIEIINKVGDRILSVDYVTKK